MNTSANNRRIAKNTMFLYIRMLLMMTISLYTSRVVLATLGVSDYGIYNVVGGFVALFTMVSGTMATATQRFLSFEIGRNCQENITRVFSTSIIIHIFLSVLILLLAETFGLWFVNTQMVFPEERMVAVNWVYQFSVLTLIANVLSVPYNASLIAFERMAAFAYIGILEVLLKLAIVFLMQITAMDKLVFYAFFLMLIAIGLRILYNFYVNRHFKCCQCTWKMDPEYRRSMLSFIGFNFIGSTANILKTQGINVLLNIFFGTTVNAARGISVQVLNAVAGFVTNFQLALNPQIIKLYAEEEKEKMFSLMFRGSKFSFLLMSLISFPIIIETPYILGLWLVEVPPHTVIFVRLTLAITLIDSLSQTLTTGVHASGYVKKYQLINGTMLMTTLPLVYIVLKLGFPPYMAFVVSLFISIVCHFIRLHILKNIMGFPVILFIKNITFRVFMVSVVAMSVPVFFILKVEPNLISFLIGSLTTFISVLLSEYYLGLNGEEKKYIKIWIIEKIGNKKEKK